MTANGCNRIRNGDICQIETIFKSRITNSSNGIRNRDASQVETMIENMIANGSNAAVKINVQMLVR